VTALRILVDSLADKGLVNAQMTNAREIIRRLDPEQFHVSTFYVNESDPRLVERRNTRLIHLPSHLKTIKIFREFVLGRHEILFYLKASPASKWYLQLREKWRDHRVVIGTVEGQSNVRTEPTIAPEEWRICPHFATQFSGGEGSGLRAAKRKPLMCHQVAAEVP
jgi:hypothetical protein